MSQRTVEHLTTGLSFGHDCIAQLNFNALNVTHFLSVKGTQGIPEIAIKKVVAIFHITPKQQKL